MGLNMLLSCKNSGLIDTVVSVTVTIRVFSSRTSLTSNGNFFYLISIKQVPNRLNAGFQVSNSATDALRYLTVHLWYPLVTVLIFSQRVYRTNSKYWRIMARRILNNTMLSMINSDPQSHMLLCSNSS